MVNLKRTTIACVLSILIIFQTFIITYADSELTTSLKNNLQPLKTTKAGNGFEDLDTLRDAVKDVKIFAAGEATHGTKEFFEMKHRLLEFLVEEMGYRVFAMETPFGSERIINDYILNGVGSAEQVVLSMMMWPWSTTEVVDMIEWMKEFNDNPTNNSKIKFYGFDFQIIESSISNIKEYLKIVDTDYYPVFSEYISRLGTHFAFNKYDESVIKSFDLALSETKDKFEENKSNYISKSSGLDYDINLKELDIMNQWIEYRKMAHSNGETEYSTFELRDKFMADNINWIMNYEESQGNDKIMLWGHNVHIAKGFKHFTTVGELLKNTYGDSYYALGFEFYKGAFRSIPVDKEGTPIKNEIAKFVINSSPKNTLAHELEKTGIPLGYINLKSSTGNPTLSEYLSKDNKMNAQGTVYYGKYFKSKYLYEFNPMDSFDGLIFISESNVADAINRFVRTNEDGDKIIADYYKNYFIAGVAIIIVSATLIIYFFIRVKKKRKKISSKQQNL